jgi:hypothetical protein
MGGFAHYSYSLFTDIVSGIVLVIADRMANKNVDFYKYPEGRSRVEPIGMRLTSYFYVNSLARFKP